MINKKIEIVVDKNERWPDYEIIKSDCLGDPIEVTKKQLDWIKKTTKEYNKVQEFIDKKINK